MLKSTDFLQTYHRASRRDKEVLLCRICAQIANSFLLEDYVWVFSWEEAVQLVVRSLWRKHDWKAPNRPAGGANRRKYRPGKDVQSACGTARSV